MSFGNIYSVDVQSAFSDDVLGTIEKAITAECDIDDAHYPKIIQCDIRSGTKFAVRFNAECKMEAARLPSGEYGVCFHGGIDRIVFEDLETVSWMQVEWAYAGKVMHPTAIAAEGDAEADTSADKELQ